MLLAIGCVTVLVLGAAANGFEPSLEHVRASTPAQPTSSGQAPRPLGVSLHVSVVRLVVDADGTAAVIIRVTNPSPTRALTNAPVVIGLFDRTREVGTSGAAGTNPLFVHIPYVRPGESALFVSDSVATSAVPSEARATATARYSGVQHVQLRVRALRLRMSTVRSVRWFADGTLVGPVTTARRNVLVQAVVLRGRRFVAAGTTIVEVAPRGRGTPFEIDLHGDPKGGALRVWAPPQ